MKLEAEKYYTIKDILALGVIPRVKSHYGVYNLLTGNAVDPVTKKRKFTLHTQTTKKTIKARHDGMDWNKISGRISVQGAELIKFLRLNHLL